MRLPYSRAEAVDPEEALVAALSSCHMLTFLYLAAKQGYVIDSYADEAVGVMTKNARGKLFVSKVALRPRIAFAGRKQPSAAELAELHHHAHEECYIANSVLTEVVVDPAPAFCSTRLGPLRPCATCRSPMPTARPCWRKIGVADIDALFADMPKDKRLDGLRRSAQGQGRDGGGAQRSARLAAQNTPAGSVPFFVGAGAYKHHVPASVDHLIQRSEFLTSYTPYQPEIAQGTLQYLFEFQTQVAMLTGMEVANASMYDGSTAAAEAVLMAHRVTKRRKAVLAGNLHPHYRETIETVARLAGHEIVALPPAPARQARTWRRRSTTRCRASSCRHPISTATCTI